MSRYYGGWAPYVPVAERRRKAERAMEKLRKTGHPVAPVTITGRTIATTFWGRAWCDNMESYHDSQGSPHFGFRRGAYWHDYAHDD